MIDGLADVRALVFSDRDLRDICAEILTLLNVRERGVETLEFNDLDVIVDLEQHAVTFRGVLSVNDVEVRMPEERFVDLALAVAEPHTGDQLVEWLKRRDRRVWPMPPAPD